MTQKRGHDVLDAFLTQRGITNRDFALRVQLVRRHDSAPTGPLVSHWRCGRKVPDHDTRIWIELASEGCVPAGVWPEQEPGVHRKKEKGQ